MDLVRDYLNQVVQEIRWVNRLDGGNHTPHFPWFVTHYVDSMPIGSMGGALSDVLFNPKHASHICKVAVAIDSLGSIVWICPLAPSTSADVLIWGREDPQQTKGHFTDYEFGPNKGALKAPLCLSLGVLASQSISTTTTMSTAIIG